MNLQDDWGNELMVWKRLFRGWKITNLIGLKWTYFDLKLAYPRIFNVQRSSLNIV